MTDQDFIKGIDLTTVPTATPSQVQQLMEAGTPATTRGLVVGTTDTSLETPDVPAADSSTKYKHYLWLRARHSSDSVKRREAYVWDDNATNDATFKKWSRVNIFPKQFTVIDPIDYGADPTGVTDSSIAIRKAVYKANSVGGIVRFGEPGIYLVSCPASYGATESQPYLYGTTKLTRVKTVADGMLANPIVPLFNNSIITAVPGVTIKLAVWAGGLYNSGGVPATVLMDGRGRSGIIIENITFDGQVTLQPVVLGTVASVDYNVAGGSTAAAEGMPTGNYTAIHTGGIACNVIDLGNDSVARFNTIKNFGGFAAIPVAVNDYSAIKATGGQVTIGFGEPHVIAVANRCEVYGNRISQCWTGGIITVGGFNNVHENHIEDIAGNGISSWFPRANYCHPTALGSYAVYFMHASPIEAYKGVDLGTLSGISSGFFGASGTDFEATVYTDAQMSDASKTGYPSGAKTDWDRSAYRYWAINNIFKDNFVARSAYKLAHVEESLGTIFRNNHFIHDIPNLPKLGATFPIPLTVGKYLTNIPAKLCDQLSTSGDLTFCDNDIYYSDKLHAASPTICPIVIMDGGLNKPLGADNVTPSTTEQTVRQTACITGNRLINADRAAYALDQFPIYNNTNGYYARVNINSVPWDGVAVLDTNYVQAVTEFTLDPEPLSGTIVGADALMCVVGRFKFIDIMRNDNVPSMLWYINQTGTYASAHGTNFGTRRPNFRLFLMRKDTLWEFEYSIKIKDRSNINFVIYEKGKIFFSYSTGVINRYERIVEEIDYRDGTIHAEGMSSLIPQNKSYPSGRILTEPYRGGIAFYASLWDTTKFKAETQLTINENLRFEFEGRITEI